VGPAILTEDEMSAGLDQLLARYENGHLTRRDLLGAIAALVAAHKKVLAG
jgi:hypothetical protein